MKIENDKYYTPAEVAEYCVDRTFEILDAAGCRVDHIIEPSAGGWVFILFIKKYDVARNLTPSWYFDILPEHPEIEQDDWCTADVPYWQNRLIIGNPPFGTGDQGKLLTKFIKATCCRGDFVSFILPIQNYNRKSKIWQAQNFELIYSEDLGILTYSGHDVHCCLNIYVKDDVNLKPLVILPYFGCYHRSRDFKLYKTLLSNNSVVYLFCTWGSLFKKIGCIRFLC